MKKYVIIAIIALLIIVAVSILIYCIDGKLRSGNVIKVSGSIEATETRLSFRVGGKIERLFVDEGNYISGDINIKNNIENYTYKDFVYHKLKTSHFILLDFFLNPEDTYLAYDFIKDKKK